MIVQVAFIQVGGDDDLKPVAPHLLCQLHADLMAPLWGHLSRFETLIAMPRDVLVLLAIPLLGQDHLTEHRLLQAVDDGDKRAVRGFLWVLDVRKYVEEVLGALGDGFLRVFHIGDQVAEAALDVPQAGGCHVRPPPVRTGRAFQARNILLPLPGSRRSGVPAYRGFHTRRPAVPKTPRVAWAWAAYPNKSAGDIRIGSGRTGRRHAPAWSFLRPSVGFSAVLFCSWYSK